MPDNSPRHGFVYVLTNPAYAGLVKIGHTARDPQTRAAELSTTGVPARFVVAWARAVTDHEALEDIVHRRLGHCRANDNREFFRCSVPHARAVIEKEAAALLLPWWRAWPRRLVQPAPQPARVRRLRRYRSHVDRSGLLFVPAVLATTYVLVVKPAWLPPSFLHLLAMLPQFGGPPATWPP